MVRLVGGPFHGEEVEWDIEGYSAEIWPDGSLEPLRAPGPRTYLRINADEAIYVDERGPVNETGRDVR